MSKTHISVGFRCSFDQILVARHMGKSAARKDVTSRNSASFRTGSEQWKRRNQLAHHMTSNRKTEHVHIT